MLDGFDISSDGVYFALPASASEHRGGARMTGRSSSFFGGRRKPRIQVMHRPGISIFDHGVMDMRSSPNCTRFESFRI